MTGTWCCELELSTGAVEAVVPRGDQARARVLVRLHGDPLGYLPASLPLDVATVTAEARQRFASRIAQVEADDRTAPDGDPVSVVVCTRDRAGARHHPGLPGVPAVRGQRRRGDVRGRRCGHEARARPPGAGHRGASGSAERERMPR